METGNTNSELYKLRIEILLSRQGILLNSLNINTSLTCFLLLFYQDSQNVRGIFLDMSKLTKSISLDSSTFIDMRNLRYLKIYNSCCPRQCIADCKVHFPKGLEFPLEEVRYLHWLKFPFKELPTDFRPENLVDLRLPHSNIERVWKGYKVCLHVPSF